MHGDLEPAAGDDFENPRDGPVLATLAFGGALTLAWMAFLVWALIQILNWMIS
jgi:hypothetical protein